MELDNTLTYVISLVGSTNRREKASSQMQTAGIQYRFFDAISAEELPEHYIKSFDKRKFLVCNGRQHHANEIACFASHRELWRLCASGTENFFVFEDDFTLIDDNPITLTKIAHLGSEYGFIRLEGTRPKPFRRVETSTYGNLIRYLKIPQRATGYRITPEAAAMLYKASHVIYHPVDVFLRQIHLHGVQIYGVQPAPITHAGTSVPSDIGNRGSLPRPLWSRATRIAYRSGAGLLNALTQARFDLNQLYRTG
mgnify:CR=1 FL=1